MAQLSGEIRGGSSSKPYLPAWAQPKPPPPAIARPPAQAPVYVPPTAAPPAWPVPQISSQPAAPQNYATGNWDMTGGSSNGGWGTNAGGGSYGGGGGGNVAPAPAPPPPPRLTSDDFASKYKGNDNGLALVDSTFGDQQSMYANVLKKYIEDYSRQYGTKGQEYTGTLGRDAKVAHDGIARNKENGLTSQAEDFFARGVGNSGMFASEQDKARDQFDKQKINVSDSLRDSRADLDFRKSKFEGENGANGSNVQAARRDAYNRLALKQGLT